MLAIKINNKGSFVVIDKVNIDKFKLDNYMIYKDYILTDLDTFLANNKDAILKLSS